jgi:hypothetical protein
MEPTMKTLITLLIAALLASCGGGGDDGFSCAVKPGEVVDPQNQQWLEHCFVTHPPQSN